MEILKTNPWKAAIIRVFETADGAPPEQPKRLKYCFGEVLAHVQEHQNSF
jgi:hypothetical protein